MSNRESSLTGGGSDVWPAGATAPKDGRTATRAEGPGAVKHPLRVLVVDDDADVADSFFRLVKMWGHEVDVAYTGAAAVARTSVYEPDVLLLDVAMPVMDGCEVARQLRRQARFARTLLIAVTGYADEEDELVCQKAGFDYHLSKPVSLSTLERILLFLQQGRGESPRALLEAGARSCLERPISAEDVASTLAHARAGTQPSRRTPNLKSTEVSDD
jgi:CheY-like chemotaxis protein